jgi:hypothetical protein
MGQAITMKLYSFTSLTNEDASEIVCVAGRIADHPEPTEPTEWIDFRIAIAAPIVLSGALLRAKALRQAIDTLHELAAYFERLERQTPPNI